MYGKTRKALMNVVMLVAILAMAPYGVGRAQEPPPARPPAPATPFDVPPMPSADAAPQREPLLAPPIGDTFQQGGERLTSVQNVDGGWEWFITDAESSPLNIISPVGMGLAKAFEHTGDPDMEAALADAGALLMTKSGNFSPSDGSLAAELDAVFGVTTYSDYVHLHFYDLLAAGTYFRSSAPVGPYNTTTYIDRIQSVRPVNLRAWDIGTGLVAAAMVGADTGPWIVAAKEEINQLDPGTALVPKYYDVIGLAGAVYGLAFVGEDFDPTAGAHAAAWNLHGLGNILASYQLSTGGFTWNANFQNEGETNETTQETAYAILALNALDRGAFLPPIIWGSDFLDGRQLGTGGWDNYEGEPSGPNSGENNELTGEALWALDAGYDMGDVWVCPSGDCGHPEASYNTVAEGIENVRLGGTVHILAGTYEEQVTVTRPMNLFGEDPDTTIILSPDTLGTCFTTKKPIICVKDTFARVMNLTVDGAGKGSANSQFVGIAYYNADGTVDNNTIKGLTGDTNGGVGMYANNADAYPRMLHVTNNRISDYEKNGMALSGDGLTVDVSVNSVVGHGPTGAIAQNGIQVGFGAGGAISNNDVNQHTWTGTYGGSNNPFTDPEADGASGILLYHPGSAVEINNNVVWENQFGVWSVGAPSVNIHDNEIHGLAHTGSAFPTAVSIFSADQWSDDFGFPEVGTTATINNNILEGNDYNLLVLDYTGGGPAPSATASGNTFSNGGVQVASTDGTIDIPTTLGANGFDRGVVVHGSPYLPMIWSAIQDGVDAAAPADTVYAIAGTYVENITIPKPLTLMGDLGFTKILPAFSNPDCSVGGGSGPFCAGGSPKASTVILVQANDVTIQTLTIDGNNPDLTSGVIRGGADLDARNGIIANYETPATYANLHIHSVTVENIYLRGINTRGSFNFHDNTVTNVQGDGASIGMFAWYGPGLFNNNTVSYANDGISANHSQGIQFVFNTVTHSGSGVHTDNAGDAGGVADLIGNNTISDCNSAAGGYGIFVFVPYIAPAVNNNTVTNCQYGVSYWGQGAPVSTSFTNNAIDGSGLADSIGAWINTDLTPIYDAIFMDATVNFSGNTFTNNTKGVMLTGDAGHTVDATFTCNEIRGNTSGVDKGLLGTYTNDFTHNWWGTATGPYNAADNPTGTGNAVADGIAFSPWNIDDTCGDSVPPFSTTTSITSDLPDPSGKTENVTVEFQVSNDLSGGPAPTGTVDVYEGLNLICDDAALTPDADTTSTGSCIYAFASEGSYTLTAAYTPADSTFITSTSAGESHSVGNRAPVITEGASVNVDMDEDGAPTAFSLTLNATDADGDTINWSISSAASHGTASASGTGLSKSIGYDPNPGYIGTDSFEVQVDDGDGGTDAITVNVTIHAVNDAPIIAEGASANVSMDEDGSPTAFLLVLNASDVEMDTLTWSISSAASHGLATASGTGFVKHVHYTPTANYFGSDTFDVQVDDGNGGSDSITVNVTINAVNDAPVITESDPANVSMDEDGTPTPFSLTLNATDIELDTLTWSISTPASHGTASASGTGTSKAIGYAPDLDYTGADSFVVQVSDGNGGTDSITVNVTIGTANDAPVITEGASANVTMDEDGAPTAFSLTLHATDADLDTLTWSISSPASNGSATASGTGLFKAISYTPGLEYSGSDSFDVQVNDGNGGTDTLTVNVTVNAVNDAPIITEGASIGVTMSEEGSPTAFGLTLNATDAEGDTLTWSISSPPWHGNATASGTGLSKAIGYAPDLNYFGADSFIVQVADGNGGTDVITVNVTVEGVEEAPIITEGTIVVLTMDTNGVPVPFALTLHATDVDNDTLTWSISSPAVRGVATASGTGLSKDIHYVPNLNYAGPDDFIVQVDDGAGGTDTIRVSVTVGIVHYQPKSSTFRASSPSLAANKNVKPTVTSAGAALPVNGTPRSAYRRLLIQR